MLWRRNLPYLTKHQQYISRRLLFSFSPLAEGKRLTHKERRLLKYPPEHVYNVVANVKDYRFFVPYCVESNILVTKPNYLEAELVVGFHFLSERYTSRVTLVPGKKVTAKAMGTQLFVFLDNVWEFEPGLTSETTWLNFIVDYQFRSQLYSQASEMFFDEVVKKMVNAFDRRCAETYNPNDYLPSTVSASTQTHVGMGNKIDGENDDMLGNGKERQVFSNHKDIVNRPTTRASLTMPSPTKAKQPPKMIPQSFLW